PSRCAPCLQLWRAPHRAPPSFPTRRSSDLSTRDSARGVMGLVESAPGRRSRRPVPGRDQGVIVTWKIVVVPPPAATVPLLVVTVDRKSTRLNSSHVKISYAVFCLKKKRHPQ